MEFKILTVRNLLFVFILSFVLSVNSNKWVYFVTGLSLEQR